MLQKYNCKIFYTVLGFSLLLSKSNEPDNLKNAYEIKSSSEFYLSSIFKVPDRYFEFSAPNPSSNEVFWSS